MYQDDEEDRLRRADDQAVTRSTSPDHVRTQPGCERSQAVVSSTLTDRQVTAAQQARNIGTLLGCYESEKVKVGACWIAEFGYDTCLAFINAGVTYPHLVRDCIDAGITADMVVATGLAAQYNNFNVSTEEIMLAVAAIYRSE